MTDAPPGYIQTEVGVIPEEWDAICVADVGFVKGDKRLPAGFILTEHPTSHPYVKVSDMYPGSVDLAAIKCAHFHGTDVAKPIPSYPVYKGTVFNLVDAAGDFVLSDGFTATIHRAGSASPATGEVAGEVARVVLVLEGSMKCTEIQARLGLRHEDHFRDAYIVPALEAGYATMIIPDKPRSRGQKYRLTAKGQSLKALGKGPPRE